MVTDSIKSVQMNAAAKEITEYQHTIQNILKNYTIFASPTSYDIRRIKNLVDMMENKLKFIENKMSTLDSYHLPLTFIIMPNGQQLSVTEYVKLYKTLIPQHFDLTLFISS